MKLPSFLAGVFGTLGFGLSVLAGLSAGNGVEVVLTRALLLAGLCCAVGYVAGLIARQVAHEHAQRVAGTIARQDSAEEIRRLEEQARQDAVAAAEAGAATAESGGAGAAPPAR